MSRERVRRLLGLLLAAGTLAVPAAGLAVGDSPHDRQDAIEDQLERTREQIESARADERDLADEISTQNEEIATVHGRIDALGAELQALEGELALARDRLRQTESELEEETRQLARLRRELAVAQERLAERAVEIYTTEQPDLLSIVLGTDDLGGLLDQIELYEMLLDQDSRLIAQVELLRGDTARARQATLALRRRQARATAELAARAEKRRTLQASMVAESDRLAAVRREREAALASIQVRRRDWEAEADALEAESRQLASLIAASSSPAPSSGGGDGYDTHFETPGGGAAGAGGLIWPLQGTVTSPYGMRWGRLHAGIDIVAPAGAPIVAAAAGTVIYAGWMGGYGLLVLVQHGNGLVTAYAHNSSVTVSQGQRVSQGQTVALVGCTGHCTGDHVHFEVRVGGSPVDPLGYL